MLTRGERIMEQQETGIYIFCGVEATDEEDFGHVEFEGEKRAIFTIHYENAAMVATEVPMKIYHPNKENLMMHQQVISRVMDKNDTVIPISFGNVFNSKGDVEVLLQNLHPQFTELFPKIKGKIELGLKVIGKKEWLEKRVNQHPEIDEMTRTVQAKSKEAGYYDRIKLGGKAQELFNQLQCEVKTDIFEQLEEKAEAAKDNDPISETMLLNASFLVDREKEVEFDELVNEAHERWKDQVEFNYTGPWPAYNFINIRLTVEEA